MTADREPSNAWPPANDGWTYELLGGEDGQVHRFSAQHSGNPLGLGAIPDGARIEVRNQQNDRITLKSTSAKRTKIRFVRPLDALHLVGKYNRIEATGRQDAPITATVAPTSLVLHGAWSLGGNRPQGDRFKVVLDGNDGDTVQLQDGNPTSIEGRCGTLVVGGLDGQTDIDVDAIVQTRTELTLGTVRCHRLVARKALTARLIEATGMKTSFAVTCDGGLSAARVAASRSVQAQSVHIDDLRIELGHLVISRTQLDAQQHERANSTGSSTGGHKIEPAVVPQHPDASTLGDVDIIEGALLGGAIELTSAERFTVNGLVAVDSIATTGEVELKADLMRVKTLDAPNAAVIARHLHIVGLARAASVDAATAHLEGDVDVAQFKSENVVVDGRFNGNLTSTIRCTLSHDSEIAGGALLVTGDLAVSATAKVETLQSKAHDKPLNIEINGIVENATIDGTTHPVAVTGAAIQPKSGTFTISGSVKIRPTAAAGGKGAPTDLGTIVCRGANTKLVVAADTTVSAKVQTAGSGTRIVTSGKAVDLKVTRLFSAHVEVGANTTIRARDNGMDKHPAPTITYDGIGKLTLSGTFGCVESLNGRCELSVSKDAVLEDVRGPICAVVLHGSIASSRDGHQSPATLYRLAMSSESSMVVSDTARVAGLDLSNLSHQEIEMLKAAEYVEPDRQSLVQHAEAGDLSLPQIRTRAQWMLNLHQLMETKAVPGSVRVAAGWSAARLQHEATRRGNRGGWEWWFRQLHRALGYGYKLWPPIVTWVAMTGVFTLFSIGKSIINVPMLCSDTAPPGQSVCSRTAEDVASAFFSTLGFPFRLLRITPDVEVFEFVWVGFRPLVGVTVGVPFVFALIATRRFFKLPHDG